RPWPSRAAARRGARVQARRSRGKPRAHARRGSGYRTCLVPRSMRGRAGVVQEDQVVAADDGAAVVETEDVLDLLAVAAGDALQVGSVVLHQPAADATPFLADQVDHG